jgi:hypothetical protein
MPSLDFSQAWPWLQWVIAVAAVVAFIAGAIRTVPPAWRVVSTFVKTINALADLPGELEKQAQFRADTERTLAGQDKQIADIHHEVHYNNGSSVKDAIRRVEQKLDEKEK